MFNEIEITVVIPHHRDVPALLRAVYSVASQIFQPVEIIVVNDDDCPLCTDLILRLQSISSRLWILETERCWGGPAQPRNIAVDQAKGNYIVFLDADDLWLPNHLDVFARIWSTSVDVIVHGHQLCWGFDLARPFFQAGLSTQPNPEKTFRRLLRNGNTIFLSSSGLPRKLIQSYKFDQDLIWEDFDLWLRLSQDGHSFVNSHSCSTIYQIREGSRSGRRDARRLAASQFTDKYFKGRPFFLLPPWLLRNLYL